MKLVYSSEMEFSVGSNAFPIGIKGRLVTKAVLDCGLPIEVIPAEPLTRDRIKLAHAGGYVDGVLDLNVDNGLFNRDPEVAKALPYHCGGMLLAAEVALDEGIAVLPFGTFHHAEYAKGHGLCTFNGIMVAAMNLRETGRVKRVAIIDTDLHYGDGTDNIIKTLGLTDFFHYSTGKHFTGPSDAPEYMAKIATIKTDLEKFRPDILFYQAGGDAHLEDPFVGPLSTHEMYLRDKTIFNACKELKLPVAVTLSGGYQRDADGGFIRQTRLYLNTLRAALGMPCEDDMTEEEVKMARLRVRPDFL
jgi:acetoin utilization deacetylase AcuC-like enzyme